MATRPTRPKEIPFCPKRVANDAGFWIAYGSGAMQSSAIGAIGECTGLLTVPFNVARRVRLFKRQNRLRCDCTVRIQIGIG